MADFRMGIVDPAINLAIEDQANTNACADRYVDQTRFVASCAPPRFAKGRGVGIVFYGNTDGEGAFEVLDWIFSIPVGKEIDIANFAGKRIDGSGRADADASDFLGGYCFSFTKHSNNGVDGTRVSSFCIGGNLGSCKDATFGIHDANGDLGATDVYCADDCVFRDSMVASLFPLEDRRVEGSR